MNVFDRILKEAESGGFETPDSGLVSQLARTLEKAATIAGQLDAQQNTAGGTIWDNLSEQLSSMVDALDSGDFGSLYKDSF